MRVLLSGGTGFVGSSILSALTAAGHDVVAIVRSKESATAVEAAGATALVHALPDTAWLTDALASSDGFIHAATPGDETGPAFDDSVIDSVVAAYSGTDKSYLHTGGIWVYGSGADLAEETPLAAPAITAWREEREARLLASGVRASVIAPAIVYGYGKGIPNTIIDAPRSAHGALRLVGSGDQHWATVHVDDLADLYVAALESAPGGEIYIAANGQNPTVRQLGEAVVGPEGAVVGEHPHATSDRLGVAFTEAILLDQQASGAKAKATFGWAPHRPSLVEELAAASVTA
jgi:nucleoside-diphosphate-sugar epimerase